MGRLGELILMLENLIKLHFHAMGCTRNYLAGKCSDYLAGNMNMDEEVVNV